MIDPGTRCPQSSATSPEGRAELPPAAEADAKAMSVRQLRAALAAAGVSDAGCVEKRDLVELLDTPMRRRAGHRYGEV
eukprot:gene12177-36506_t